MSILGWLTAGLIGAAIVSDNDRPLVSRQDKICQLCGNSSEFWVIDEDSNYIYVKFRCNNCSRTWTKAYTKKY